MNFETLIFPFLLAKKKKEKETQGKVKSNQLSQI